MHMIPYAGLRVLAFALLLLVALPVAAQGRYSGALESGDDTLTSGEFSDSYPVSLRRGQWVEVVMRSGDFDPYLILRPPTCAGKGGACDGQFDNDDFFPDGASFLWVEADEAGTWEVLATSYAPGDKGAYTLDVIVHPDGSGPQTPGTMLDAPRTERGALAAGDGTLNSGEYVDRYAFDGDRQRVGNPIRPRVTIVVAAHGIDRRDQSELVENPRVADVAGVDDTVATGERCASFRSQQAVGVGDKTETRHRI